MPAFAGVAAALYWPTMTGPRFAYPIMLRLSGRRALVVGGGNVALRKARTLADAGAAVRVVGTDFLPEFRADARLECVQEPYAARHLAGVALVVAATDDEAVNARVAEDARAAGALVNVVDRPALCDFVVPSVVEQGNLTIAISTGGASPSLARRLRERLQDQFGPHYATYLDVIADVRADFQARDLADDMRRRIFERLSRDDIVGAARDGCDALRRVVDEAVAGVLAGGPSAPAAGDGAARGRAADGASAAPARGQGVGAAAPAPEHSALRWPVFLAAFACLVAANVWMTCPRHAAAGSLLEPILALAANPLAFVAAGWLAGRRRWWAPTFGAAVVLAVMWLGRTAWGAFFEGSQSVPFFLGRAAALPMLLVVAGCVGLYLLGLVAGRWRADEADMQDD